MVSVEGIIGVFLVLGAGYWLITNLLNKVKSEILEKFLTDSQISNGLVFLTSLTLIVLVGSQVLTQLSYALATEYGIAGYINAIKTPFDVVNSGIGALWTLLTVAAVIYVGSSLSSSMKK